VISLIIVSFNTRRLLKQCLESIAVQCPDAEVVVVDNASADGSAEMVQADFPGVKLVNSPVNEGFAAANNLGLAVATGDYLVLLNSDTVLEDDTLTRCAAWMGDHPEIGAASPRLIGVDDRPQICLRRVPRLVDMSYLGRRFFTKDPTFETDGEGWLAGTALMVRRDALASVGGGLDQGYFMYWEDTDLSMRLLKAGWKLAKFNDGYIRHLGGASAGGSSTNLKGDLLAWFIYGKHRWFARNRPAWEAVSLWFIEGANALQNVVKGLIRPSRRQEECTLAMVIAKVLALRLVGLAPPRPRSNHQRVAPIAESCRQAT
jgi:GT2 family glycosyltransferase